MKCFFLKLIRAKNIYLSNEFKEVILNNTDVVVEVTPSEQHIEFVRNGAIRNSEEVLKSVKKTFSVSSVLTNLGLFFMHRNRRKGTRLFFVKKKKKTYVVHVMFFGLVKKWCIFLESVDENRYESSDWWREDCQIAV